MTIRSEGGLMPRDLLARIADQDPELGGLTEDAFHLDRGDRLGEAIARSWARLTGAWTVFSDERDQLNDGDTTGRLTRERWLLPLFSELGYGRLVQRPAVELGERHFAVFSEFQNSPIHLVGAGVPLDRRTSGVRGAAEQSPHSLVQELLNRSDERLWGIVTNGLSLRLLRDNVTLTRQAYVEWDLESIFAGEAYEDFALLWLSCHQSRLEAERPEDCWLERWTQIAERDGTRALDALRDGVERAIEELGRGFLAHRANTALQNSLEEGTLDGQGYYRQLLRLVYRLLFCFVAEDRDVLLLAEDGTTQRHDARARFTDYYGTARIRRLAGRRRGGRAHDLYEQLKLLFSWLHDEGQSVLALPPLGSALWDPATTPQLANARIDNEHLLEALRRLAYVDGGRRPVDFRHLGAEELGSIYESLLELHPELDRTTATFALRTAAGHERRQTGSYYTPTSLIGSLLETALDPVIGQAAAADDAEQALLDLTVCDPACGSGHFLIAAANRIAKRLASIREQDPEPSPSATRHALRDVVSRCIYGIDVNPMAVELCKVSLWLETLEPGRPLSFLEDRILVGNSLVGTTPSLIAAGVPDEAFKPLFGDDKDVAKAWREHNAHERTGQTSMRLALADPDGDAASLTASATAIQQIADDTLDGVRRRDAALRALLISEERERLRLTADTWISAFVAPKVPGAARITTDVVRRAETGGAAALSAEELSTIRAEVERYAPLHLHVAFPTIFRAREGKGTHGWEGGFDCVLGNPPWERVKLQEKEFFAATAPRIADAKNKAARERLIVSLADDDPILYQAFHRAKRHAEGQSHLLRSTGRFPLCGRGDVNTYAVFAELARSSRRNGGRAGLVVPTGIATDDTTRFFFDALMDERDLASLYDFRNAGFFPDVAAAQGVRFCLLTMGRGEGAGASFVFRATAVEETHQPERRLEITRDDIAQVNPLSRTVPIVTTSEAWRLLRKAQQAHPAFCDGPWDVRFTTMFHMSGDSVLFKDRDDLREAGATACLDGSWSRGRERFLPLYEGKMFHIYNHRFGDYRGVPLGPAGVRQLPTPSDEDLGDFSFVTTPRYWVAESAAIRALKLPGPSPYLFGWRDITDSIETTYRTLVCSVLPWAAVGHTTPLLFSDTSPTLHPALFALLSSTCVDFIVRQKLAGTHLTYGVMNQLPIPGPDALADRWSQGCSYLELLRSRFEELVCTASDMAGFARHVGYGPIEDRPWDPRRRALLAAEIDAAAFALYGFSADEAGWALDRFPGAAHREISRFGEHLTKRIVQEALSQHGG